MTRSRRHDRLDLCRPLAKWALDEFPSIAYVSLQPLIAFTVLFSFLAIRRMPIRFKRRDLRLVFIADILSLGASQLLNIAGFARTSVSHSVILSTSAPLVIAAYRLLIKRQRRDARSISGMIGGFLGVVILVSATGGSFGASLGGDLFVFTGAVA